MQCILLQRCTYQNNTLVTIHPTLIFPNFYFSLQTTTTHRKYSNDV